MKEINKATYIESLNRVANTDDGQIVLAFLKEYCGWDVTMIDSGSEGRTYAYAMKRGVYGSVRADIKREFLKQIEYDYRVVADVRKKEK